MSPSDKKLYRVSFFNQGKVFEIYAKNVITSNLFGFIELDSLVFGEKSSVILDPSEESLRNEFENTKRTFLPLHNVIRIDEMKSKNNLKPRVLNISSKKEDKTNNLSLSSIYPPTSSTPPFEKK